MPLKIERSFIQPLWIYFRLRGNGISRSLLLQSFYRIPSWLTSQGMDSNCIHATSALAFLYRRRTGPRRCRFFFRDRPHVKFECRHRKWLCRGSNRRIPMNILGRDQALFSVRYIHNVIRNCDIDLCKLTEINEDRLLRMINEKNKTVEVYWLAISVDIN